jgi:hypothetical protein
MIRIRLAILAGVLASFCSLGSASDATISRTTAIARMKSDLQYLASDECEGRGPGTEGINKAADFIAAAFKNAGLKPGGIDDTYFQPFTIRGTPKAPKVKVSLKGPNDLNIELAKDDCSTLSMSGGGKSKGEIVFIGHSISNEAVPYDDFKDLDIEGKIVMMLRRAPRYTGEKRFADDSTMQSVVGLVKKVENAEKNKAAAVILVNDRSTLSESGDVLTSFSTPFNGTSKIPVIHLRRDIGEIIVRKALNKTLDQLEKEIDKDLKPQNGVLKGWTCDVDVTLDPNRDIPVKNIVGVLEGFGPLANEIVIIGAHYDHLGYGGRGSMSRDNKSIHYGADDNASGTSALIELVRRFTGMKNRIGRTIVFMAFSAEERGLLGSAHYCNKEPLFPLDKTIAMINLDMVGRCAIDKDDNLEKLEIGGTGTAKSFGDMIDRHNKKYNFKLKKTATGMGPSDHQSFYLKNLPVLFFFTGLHKDYHTPTDTWDKLNLESMAKIVDMVEEVAKEVTTQEEKLEFVKVSSPSPGRQSPGMPNATLRIMMDYNDDSKNVVLTGVMPDGPAEKAGLKEGDRILEINGVAISNATSYMTEMFKVEKDKPVAVTFDRKGVKKTIEIMPQWNQRSQGRSGEKTSDSSKKGGE